MANVDASYGLRPVRYAWGAPYGGACRPYFAPSSYATALYIGDPVVITGTSNTADVRGFPPGSLPEINKATAGDANRTTGVIVGFYPLDGQTSNVYGAASTARVVWVADDPNLLFSVQDDAGATLAATAVGQTANYIFTNAGSNFTGRSGVELNAGTVNTTATFQLKIIGLYDIPNNELGNNAQWLVKINNHTYDTGGTGAGV